MKITVDELADILGFNKYTVINYFSNYRLTKYLKNNIVDLCIPCSDIFIHYLKCRRSNVKTRLAIERFEEWYKVNKYKLDPKTEKLFNR